MSNVPEDTWMGILAELSMWKGSNIDIGLISNQDARYIFNVWTVFDLYFLQIPKGMFFLAPVINLET